MTVRQTYINLQQSIRILIEECAISKSKELQDAGNDLKNTVAQANTYLYNEEINQNELDNYFESVIRLYKIIKVIKEDVESKANDNWFSKVKSRLLS